jgi:glycogen debranching enzyme
MDAKVGDWVVTPRHGKPVEINALWYNNLRIMSDLARAANDPQRAAAFADLAARAGLSFQEKFWNAAAGCLYDVIDDEGKPDGSIRANQAIAVSLPFSPIPLHMQRDVIATCQRTLLTPMGMRTLAPGSLGYHGRCAGDQLARDMAYHQGTVWPWLIGPFITGYVKVHGNTAEARAQAGEFLNPFRAHLHQAGIGSISEIADADPPFTPRGTIAQAWSVAEVLRSYYEDVLGLAPQWPHATAAASEPAPAPRPKTARV